VINARLAPNAAMLSTVQAIIAAEKTGAIWCDDQLVLAVLPSELAIAGELAGEHVPAVVHEAGLPKLELSADKVRTLTLLDHPHSVIAQHQAIFAANLGDRINVERCAEIAPGVFAEPGAELGQYVVSDTSRGPILLEADSVVGPFCCLSGPLQVGTNSVIRPHTTIHPYVALGHTVKVGGELDTSVLEPYSNKQHYGYLGHSYLASWINVGAGTTNSNLKNTYGEVSIVQNGQKIPTGMRLMGCVIGDYTKTAINTSILTGKLIGAGSMLYGFVARNVPSFVNFAQQFGDTTTVSLEAAITTQQRMFARRHVPHRPCDAQLLRDVFELTQNSRSDFACRPPNLG
jgi:glucose-1-phosphate thymidylyltransferase